MQFLLWKCALDPEMMRLPWWNEVAIEMINEMFCGRNEREWKKFHSLVAGTWNETGAMNGWKLISFIYSSWSSFPTAPACNTLMQLAATSGLLLPCMGPLSLFVGAGSWGGAGLCLPFVGWCWAVVIVCGCCFMGGAGLCLPFMG